MILKDLPEYVRERFESRGIRELKDCVKTDLAPDGTFAAVWVGVDLEYLYLLYGKETVRRRRGGKSETIFEETGFVLYPLRDLGKCRVERYFSTARLVSEPESGDPREILRFSLGAANGVSGLLRHLGGPEDEQKHHTAEPPPDRRKRRGPPPPMSGKNEEEIREKRKTTLRRLLGMFGEYRPFLWKYFLKLFLC